MTSVAAIARKLTLFDELAGLQMFKHINPYACIRPGLILMAFVGLILTY